MKLPRNYRIKTLVRFIQLQVNFCLVSIIILSSSLSFLLTIHFSHCGNHHVNEHASAVMLQSHSIETSNCTRPIQTTWPFQNTPLSLAYKQPTHGTQSIMTFDEDLIQVRVPQYCIATCPKILENTRSTISSSVHHTIFRKFSR